MPPALRKRVRSVKYTQPYLARRPHPKKSKLAQKDDREEATYEVDDTRLGQFTARFKVSPGLTWQSFGEPPTINVKGFAWVDWENEGPGIVYKIEQRGEHVLVICFLWALDREETGFMNELMPDTSPNGTFVLPIDTLGDTVLVYTWDEVHRIYDSVCDLYFHRTPTRKPCSRDGCSNPALNANSSYLVCANDSCLRVYHTRCLDTQALQYRGEAVYTIDGRQLACPDPECKTMFRRRGSSATQHQTPLSKEPVMKSYTFTTDVGTTRVKAGGIVEDKETIAPESIVMPLPRCFINPLTRELVFEDRKQEQKYIVIEPFKKLMTGNELDIERLSKLGLEKHDVLKQFFTDVVKWVRQSFLESIPDVDSVHITFAVACPAGLSTRLQNDILNAMFACAKYVTPVLLNEAEMGYIGSMHNHQLPLGSRVLMLDIGGYTVDMMLATIGTDAVCKPYSYNSVSCGTQWVSDKLVEWKMIQPGAQEDVASIKAEVKDLLVDFRKGRTHIIDGEPAWKKIREEQMRRGCVEIEEFLKNELIDVVVVSGGGACDDELREGFMAVVKPFLKNSLTAPIVALPPSPETSTVLQGIVRTMKQVNEGTNPLTVLIESTTTDEDCDYLIIQRKGEAIQGPLLPAGRCLGTIFFEVKAGDDPESIMDLLATSEPIETTVSGSFFQTAKNLTCKDKDSMIKNEKMWILGQIKVNFSVDKEVSRPHYLFKVVQMSIHQGHKTAQVEALLLTPRVEDTDGPPEAGTYRAWGFTEATSITEIERMSEYEASKFRVVSRMPRTIFSLDVNNTAKRTSFKY